MKILSRLPDNLFTEETRGSLSILSDFDCGASDLDQNISDHAIGFGNVDDKVSVVKLMFEKNGELFWRFFLKQALVIWKLGVAKE